MEQISAGIVEQISAEIVDKLKKHSAELLDKLRKVFSRIYWTNLAEFVEQIIEQLKEHFSRNYWTFQPNLWKTWRKHSAEIMEGIMAEFGYHCCPFGYPCFSYKYVLNFIVEKTKNFD